MGAGMSNPMDAEKQERMKEICEEAGPQQLPRQLRKGAGGA